MGVARAGRSEAVHPAGGGVGVARVRRRHHARHVRRHCGHMLQLHRQRLVRPKQEVVAQPVVAVARRVVVCAKPSRGMS